jgi:hypothetical protein
MTPDEVREIAHQVVVESTTAQGLPYYVEDEAVLHKVALLLADGQQGGDGRGEAA